MSSRGKRPIDYYPAQGNPCNRAPSSNHLEHRFVFYIPGTRYIGFSVYFTTVSRFSWPNFLIPLRSVFQKVSLFVFIRAVFNDTFRLLFLNRGPTHYTVCTHYSSGTICLLKAIFLLFFYYLRRHIYNIYTSSFGDLLDKTEPCSRRQTGYNLRTKDWLPVST